MQGPARIVIRPAQPGDAATLTDLTEQLGYPASVHAIAARLANLLGLPEHALFVATADDQVRGWVHVFKAHRLETDDCAEIGGLVVDTAWRGQGVGKSLMAAAETWARSLALTKVRVRSNIVREGAHRFYERLGYASLKRSTVFTRSLEPRQ